VINYLFGKEKETKGEIFYVKMEKIKMKQ